MKKSVSIEVITASAEKGAEGLHVLEAILKVFQNTEANVRLDLSGFRKAQADYRDAITAALAATKAQQAAYGEAYEYISYARDVLKRAIGMNYSEAWGSAGFINKSLRVPTSLDGRLNLLNALQVYFEGHPEAEVAAINVTHLRAGELYELLATSIAAANTARTTQRQQKLARNAALAALRKRLQGLRAELKQLMADDDPRWLDFGFDVPADVHVTVAPEGLKLTLDANGHLVASWEPTVNTDRFRVYKRVAGVDTEYVAVDTTTDTSFDLGVFGSGAHVDVQVTAINSAGESVPSQTAELVIP